MTKPLGEAVHHAFSVMSEEQFKALPVIARVDARLRQKLQLVSDVDAVIAFAVAAGYSSSLEQLNRPHSVRTELPDDRLEGVAGGVFRGRWQPFP